MDATILGGLGLAAALTSSMAPGVLMRPVRDRLTRATARAVTREEARHVECLAIRTEGGCVGLTARERPARPAVEAASPAPALGVLDRREVELYRAFGEAAVTEAGDAVDAEARRLLAELDDWRAS